MPEQISQQENEFEQSDAGEKTFAKSQRFYKSVEYWKKVVTGTIKKKDFGPNWKGTYYRMEDSYKQGKSWKIKGSRKRQSKLEGRDFFRNKKEIYEMRLEVD